jgi:hypothetical protein
MRGKAAVGTRKATVSRQLGCAGWGRVILDAHSAAAATSDRIAVPPMAAELRVLVRAYRVISAPTQSTLHPNPTCRLARVAGRRFTIEERLQPNKSLIGLASIRSTVGGAGTGGSRCRCSRALMPVVSPAG